MTHTSGNYYCLGAGNVCCDSCLWQKTWDDLNELEYDDRHAIQDNMSRIDSMNCRLTNMGLWSKIKTETVQ